MFRDLFPPSLSVPVRKNVTWPVLFFLSSYVGFDKEQAAVAPSAGETQDGAIHTIISHFPSLILYTSL